ncbi:MAG: DUF1569 domain-containing protein [Acidobacteria bacterium]|nr:DUF1569 domain-containing protein [Acidobacteriota bacterium]
MRTFFNPPDHQAILRRLANLSPDAPARWGRMDAPRMVAHLTDQMRHALGDIPSRPVPGLLRWAPIRFASIYLFPWPRGWVQGPPDAFISRPTAWDVDLAALRALVERFAEADPLGPWPPHALFGPMTGRDWGVFCYKHFNHHLTQFGT